MSDLFQIGQSYFHKFIFKIQSYGLAVDPAMELRRGTGMWCYYNLDDGHIYLSLPDLSDPAGKLHILFLRSLLNCDTEDELFHLMGFLVPFFISHEMGHHLRHRYGRFGDNSWEEEQVANQFAIALNKSRMGKEERSEIERLLQKAIGGFAEKIDTIDAGVDSYRDLWQALNISGSLSSSVYRQLQHINKLFSISPEEIINSKVLDFENLKSHMKQRDDVIDQINTEYAQDMMLYLYYHLSWLYLEITNHENQYISSFARQHLGVVSPLLPLIQKSSRVTDEEIKACIQAHCETENLSSVISEFFYRRYRSLLLARIGMLQSDSSPNIDRLKQEADFILHSYKNREDDMLVYLVNLAPAGLRQLFPQNINAQFDLAGSWQDNLPTETDRRLCAYILNCRSAQETADEASEKTVRLLEILLKIDAFKSLPAEILLELTHAFCILKLEKGESIIWKGDVNFDVYVLIEGELAIIISKDNKDHTLKYLKTGEMVGEMAFFTRTVRQATVRATKPSKCLVLRDTDLHLLSFKHPDILMTMGRVLARRLGEMNIAFESFKSR